MKRTKQMLSILLTVAMLPGLLPTAFAETAYTKAGEVGAVTAECDAFIEPEFGAVIQRDFNFTVTSPSDQRVSITSGYSAYWEKLSYGLWEKYTEAAFNEGTYRLQLTMNSFAFGDGSYYALSSSTTLTLNDVSFTAGKLYDHYDSQGLGSLIFYSPEYTVTKEEGTHLVTVTAGSNGLASADKAYGKTGEVVTLTAQPYDGYRLKEWRVLSGGVTVANNQFTIGSEDVEIKAIFESSNEKQDEITQVEVTRKEGVDYRPIMGNTAGRIDVTIRSSTPNDGTLSVAGYGCGIWEAKQADGRWAHFINEPFTYGTYRMRISLRNKVVDGSYHALTKDTVLIVDGEEWVADPDSLYTYYSMANGYGMISFVSEEMDALPVLDVYDGTAVGCHVVPTQGAFTVPLGDPFSFTVEPDDHYELTNPEALEVEVNEKIVTPDANGVYTVPTENTDGISIYTGGNAFTGYSNLVISGGDKTVTEKVYVGDTYTFKTLAEFGAAAPSGSAFTGWKIGGKTYQPGETYTVVGTTDINVNAAFTGLHNITVENGKAYADEAHTIPISAAAEDQVIYIVADPAPEGKVFSYWNRTFAVVGGHGWFGDSEAAVTTFTVYDSDVVLAPVYETLVDEIVISGMTKPSAGVAIDNSDYSYKWGCSVPADAGYTLGISYWYDITDGEPELAMSDGDVFHIGHTYRFKARIHLKADHIYPANPEDIAVVLSGIDVEDYRCTINEVGYTSATICFEFTCEREMTDTTVVRPAGRGTVIQPFRITNVGELYWFAGFVNGNITADDISMSVNEVHAILMNDITVNRDLLTKDYALNAKEEDTALLAAWNPIDPANGFLYTGTFDGQGHTISGIYCAPQPDGMEYGFFTSLSSNSAASGCIRDLTLADSYFCAPARNYSHTGAFVGKIDTGSTVENCHFDGTVTTAITADSVNKENYNEISIAGIVGFTEGEIRDCTSKGLIYGYGKNVGGIAASVQGKAIGCVNEATVENTRSSGYYYFTGGIAGRLGDGIIQDCCNKGDVSATKEPGGIVSYVEDSASGVIRCRNEGNIVGTEGAGIVVDMMGGSVQNCYNAGSATYAGIIGTPYNGSSVTYCHNVGNITNGSEKSIIGNTHYRFTVENCYYLGTEETDTVAETTYKTAAQFADGTVLALLNNGQWKQGESYPVLADFSRIKGTVKAEGFPQAPVAVSLTPAGETEVAYQTEVKDGAYTLEDVPYGEYTLTVTKLGYQTHSQTVTVDQSVCRFDITMEKGGDVDESGETTTADLTLLLQLLTGASAEADRSAADLNGDSAISIADAVILARVLSN